MFLVPMVSYQFMFSFLSGENVLASGICCVSEMNNFIVESSNPRNLGIDPLLDIYPREVKIFIHTSYKPMFISTLFIITKKYE